jgi:hypothetical protein
MAVLARGLVRAGVAAACERPARHGHRAQAVLTADRDGRGSGSGVHDNATGAHPGQVRSIVTAAPGGSIVICHMNHPDSGTAPGIAAAVPYLLTRGYRFVRLSDELR